MDSRMLDGLVLLKEFRRHIHLPTGVISRMTDDTLETRHTIQSCTATAIKMRSR